MPTDRVSTVALNEILVFGLRRRVGRDYERRAELRKVLLHRLFLRKISDELEERHKLMEARKRRRQLAIEPVPSAVATDIKKEEPDADKETSAPLAQSIAHFNSTSSDSALVKKEPASVTSSASSEIGLVATEAISTVDGYAEWILDQEGDLEIDEPNEEPKYTQSLLERIVLSPPGESSPVKEESSVSSITASPPECVLHTYGHCFAQATCPFSHGDVEKRNHKKDITEDIPKISRKRALAMKKLESAISTSNSSQNGSTYDQDKDEKVSDPKSSTLSPETTSKRRRHSRIVNSSNIESD